MKKILLTLFLTVLLYMYLFSQSFVIDQISAPDNTSIAELNGPSLTISTKDTSLIAGAFNVDFNFSEGVSGFEISDILIENGTISSFDSISPVHYRATVIPSDQENSTTIKVDENMVRDIAGNGNTVSNVLVFKTIMTSVKSYGGLSLTMYPNPTTGEITIEMPYLKDFILEIHDLLGRIIFYKKCIQYLGEKIDLSHLPKGVYMVSFRGNDFYYTDKLVII